MNKRGDTQWYLIGFILAVLVLLVIGFGFFYPKQRQLSKETDKLVDITKIETDLLNIKSFTLQEKEKCAKFTNINECMGNVNAKTSCFWGKTSSGIGCYSCTNNKYFNNNFGKCESYLNIGKEGKDLNNFKYLCEFNPCDFKSTRSELNKAKKCFFSTLENTPDITLEQSFCY